MAVIRELVLITDDGKTKSKREIVKNDLQYL